MPTSTRPRQIQFDMWQVKCLSIQSFFFSSFFWHVHNFHVFSFFVFFFFLSFQYKATSTSTTMPVIKSLICRVPSSVEGINHELENVFIREDLEQGIQVGSVPIPVMGQAMFQHDLDRLFNLHTCRCCEILSFTSWIKCQINAIQTLKWSIPVG